MNPLFLIDFYKVGHVSQYPPDTTQVWSNWTPRSSHVPGTKGVVFFGLQAVLKWLKEVFDTEFFSHPLGDVLREYQELVRATLGVNNPRVDHIAALHAYGYLPLAVYAIPEGFSTPLRVPQMVITNTTPDTFWLPNYLETIISNGLWKACTSATTAQRYRRIFTKAALEFGETDLGFVDWQGHDFSFRGTSGLEDACMSGMGHLLSFSGTDTVPAIVAAREFYGADLTVGGSVPATEHSVMCAGGQEGEFETFERLITEIYPEGILSIVSDTWDLWQVLTNYVPRLKEKILARNGKVVIRPDSGDPVNILCGDYCDHSHHHPCKPECKGVLHLLAEIMGTDGKGHINKAGAIYGDSITPERAQEIMNRVVKELKLSPYNVVLGIGSFTYEYVTRDTYGFAMKATAVRRHGEVIDIFKKPVTDNGNKNSLRGIPAVYRTEESTEDRPEFFVVDGQKPESLDYCEFQKVFCDGKLLVEHRFEDIRRRVRATCTQ